jgi:hypothetical protein
MKGVLTELRIEEKAGAEGSTAKTGGGEVATGRCGGRGRGSGRARGSSWPPCKALPAACLGGASGRFVPPQNGVTTAARSSVQQWRGRMGRLQGSGALRRKGVVHGVAARV